MQALDQLDSKISLLLKQYAELEAENKRLKETVASQQEANDALSKKVASLEHTMVSMHLGNTVSDEQEREAMRTQLDQVIAEIDKILHTLND